MDSTISQKLKRGFGLAFVFGILMIGMGILAISRPFFAGIAVNLYLGWVIVGGGIIQLVYAIQTREAGQLVWKLLTSILYVGAGVILLVNPLEGILTLTLIVGISVLVSGLTRTIWAFLLRPSSDWAWVLARGLLATGLGIWILLDWPADTPWLIGTLVGVNLLADGIGIVTFSAFARGTVEEIQSAAS